MVRWQLIGIQGQLGSLSAAEALAGVPMPLDAQGQSGSALKSPETNGRAGGELKIAGLAPHELLWSRLSPYVSHAHPNWVILPHAERQRRDWWWQQLGHVAEIGFGRAAVVLALSQMNRLGVTSCLLAIDAAASDQAGIDGVLALQWSPSPTGLGFDMTLVDGRLDDKTDVGAMLSAGRSLLEQPEVFFCPGNGSDGYLDRLLPFLSQLGSWAGQAVRWEFAEAALGRLGVVGSLFNWAWLEAGYRLQDWSGPSVVIELDESPLVGLSIVNWTRAS